MIKKALGVIAEPEPSNRKKQGASGQKPDAVVGRVKKEGDDRKNRAAGAEAKGGSQGSLIIGKI